MWLSCVYTYSLDLHPWEDNVEHLGEGGLGRGLVDQVPAGQVDVVACPDGLQHRALMYLTGVGGHHCQQRLYHNIEIIT